MTTQTNTSLLRKIGNFFARISDSIIEARQLQAAMNTAYHLKSHNTDFKHMSYGDIVQQIMGDIKKERE